MELAELQRNWEAFGAQDPLWAILTVPGKRFGGWSAEEFFETGRGHIRYSMGYIESLGIRLKRNKALDFGCGVGRLTQALGDEFEECHGVDISPSMIERARQFNRHGDRCHYHVNARDDLSLFPDNTFDLVFTNIVLQHMQPKYSLNYLADMLRIIVPGGVVLFQLPGGPEPIGPQTPRTRTRNQGPMPDAAFRAQITPIDRPSTLWAGTRVEMIVRVKNCSTVAWKSAGLADRLMLCLGNHWLDEKHAPVRFDDGRYDLPWDLAPGEEIDVTLSIEVPRTPGRYLLELDMVQEHAAWFKNKGSETVIIPVTVEVPPASGDFTPKMQMYSVPKEEVVSFLQQRGGKVLDVQQVNAGQGLLDYNYYVTK